MWGHQREAYLMYKRLPSRDFAKIVDMKENSALLQSSRSPETSSPSWRLSFPHVVVATITSFLFGYHIGATTKNLAGTLLGCLFVGIGMGSGPPVAALYVTEVSPAFVRGTCGSFIQIATCLGLIGALFIGIPVKEIAGWWRICFWMSTIPAAILLVGLMFCAESPHWLYKRGRTEEAETAFEKLLGGSHVKYAMAELSKSDG